MEEANKVTLPCPFDEAFFLSRWFYSWIIPLYCIGYKRPIEFSDLYKCSKKDEAVVVSTKLEREWDRELQKKNPSFLMALTRAFGWQTFWNNLIMLLSDLIIRLAQPFMLQVIIRYLEQPDGATPDYPNYVSYQMAQVMSSLLVLSSFLLQVIRHYAWFMCSLSGNNIRTSVTALLYKKVLKMSKSSSIQVDMGQVINVIANDLSRFEDISTSLNAIPLAPIMSALTIWFTYDLISDSCFVGMFIIVMLIPVQAVMGRLFIRYRRSTASVTDKRVRLMSEIIGAMKLIKFYCWEQPFANLIQSIRRDEIKEIRKSFYLKGTNSAFFFIGTRLMLFASFVTYVALGNQLRPEVVYTVMTLYNAIRLPVTNRFPQSIGAAAETMVAIRRIESILLSEEKFSPSVNNNKYNFKKVIEFVDYSGKWNSSLQHESLSNINLRIKPGQLVVVIGSVGCGKTCLLWSVLGEIHTTKGAINLYGATSYVSQEPWCFGGTIKQNILLTNEFDESRYQKVLNVCALDNDLTLFPNGDLTYVGEKGYTLSGGQKARVALARAVYHEADYYLLDDPLSAVDPKVASHIFNNCIKDHLKGKTIVLATHQLQFIEQADLVIYLQEGKVGASGSYEELFNSSDDFRDFIDARKREQEESEREKEKLERQKSLSIHSFEGEGSENGCVLAQRGASLLKNNSIEEDELADETVNRQEKNQTGSMDVNVYWNYFRSGNSIFLLSLTMFLTLSTQGLNHFIELWMSAWTNKAVVTNQNSSVIDGSLLFENEDANIAMYSILIAGLFILAFFRITLVYILCLRSSVSLHSNIFKRILRTPMLFFENNPLGRILNRFAKDIGTVDSTLPVTVGELNIMLFQVIGILVTTVVVNWYMVFPLIIIIAFAIPIRNFHLKTARDLQRLDSAARSPVFSYISETYSGLMTIRSSNIQNQMMNQYYKYLSDSTATRFLVIVVARWIGIVLDMFACVFMMAICILLMVASKDTISPGDAGVILSNSILLIGMFQGCVRTTVDIETQMVSVERVLEYGSLEPEPPAVSPNDNRAGKSWPTDGRIEFKKVNLRYSPDLPLVLKDVTFSINRGEKIGIVGRTGAGKSSLITVLFRLVELETGQVIIDDVDISTIGLNRVRKGISIIPQDPSLFSGSIRKNLDPFCEYADDQLWQALTEANLKPLVESIPNKLEGDLTEGGANLSVGQRQLLCLARALLKNNSILVLDEATANVDQETDDSIQNSIKKNFSHCTILTIAHRLNTIIDMDKVLVMGAGKVLEYDEPHVLLQNSRSAFHSMIRQTGPYYEKQLHLAAEMAYKERHGIGKTVLSTADD